jgi:hypothetical protein
MKERKKKYCSWCGKPTVMEPLQLADTPILEFMEEKIDKHGRKRIWGDDADWSTMDLDSDFEAELLVYDQMLSSVSKKTVCIGCLKEDDELWKKYYDKDDDVDFNEIIFDADF